MEIQSSLVAYAGPPAAAASLCAADCVAIQAVVLLTFFQSPWRSYTSFGAMVPLLGHMPSSHQPPVALMSYGKSTYLVHE